jgi:gliding motility-associated-like protein
VRNVCKVFGILFFLIVACKNLAAQLCDGSLGDPIVNITFGNGSNPGPQLSAATTAYQYVATDCPNDGYYAVRNSTTACFGNSWQSLTTDHTNDGSGYFMLVNASLAPSAFYLDTVKGLCGNTSYEFAAWVVNVLLQGACNGNGIQPNLTFSIEGTDGTILQSYNSGDIPSQSSPAWRQFGFFFTTPVGVSDVVLRIFNNAPGGCGNDLALDDITFRPCGPKLTPTIVGINSDTVQLCYGTPKSFSFTCTVSPPGFSSPVYQWQQTINGVWTDIPGATSTSYTKDFPATTAAGDYFFRMRAAEFGNANSLQCRIYSQPILVGVNANPTTTAINNGPVCENTTLVLTATGGSTYAWTGVNNFSGSGSSVIISPAKQTQIGKYYVLVTDDNGCISTDSTSVNVKAAPVAATTFSEVTICSGKTVQLVSSGGSVYSWLPPTALSSSTIANPTASPASTTLYVVTVTNQLACSDTASVIVTVEESPTANAGPDKTIIQGNTVTLSGSATGQSITYSWAPPVYMDNPQILQPVVNPPSDINYILKVVSSNGCGTAADTMHVFWYKDIYVPSAFTPNGDGLNDTWKIPSLSAFSSFEVVVFDRWGKLVFQGKNTSTPWDGTYHGTPAPVGSYVYQISLSQPPGLLKGTVTIVR